MAGERGWPDFTTKHTKNTKAGVARRPIGKDAA